jgi:hypothetical protein
MLSATAFVLSPAWSTAAPATTSSPGPKTPYTAWPTNFRTPKHWSTRLWSKSILCARYRLNSTLQSKTKLRVWWRTSKGSSRSRQHPILSWLSCS